MKKEVYFDNKKIVEISHKILPLIKMYKNK